MDYIFTQKELSYLDDIMPAISKKQKDDEPHDDDENEINSDMNSSNSNNAVSSMLLSHPQTRLCS
jgi:hypothetical protein